jgi:hypothetical protein
MKLKDISGWFWFLFYLAVCLFATKKSMAFGEFTKYSRFWLLLDGLMIGGFVWSLIDALRKRH